MTIVDSNANPIDTEGPELMDEDLIAKKLSRVVSKYDAEDVPKEKQYKWNIVWRNVLSLTALHIGGIYGFWTVVLSPAMPWWGGILLDLMARIFAMGVTAGSHRLWSHRSYKAKLPLRIVLMLLQTAALQDDIYQWCRDHRLHHKFSDGDADPYNAKRGFWFSHIGWLLVRKQPEVIAKGKTIPMGDVWGDSVVRFQRRFYIPLVTILWGLLPAYAFHYMTGLDFIESFTAAVLFRYLVSLHHSWLVNSAAHLWGYQLYDKKLDARENRWVVWTSMGEGYHGYHHAFPYDYSTSELGWEKNFNLSTMFIDACAWLGLAYDLKKPDPSEIEARVGRTGDLKQRNRVITMVNTTFDYLFGSLAAFNVLLVCTVLRIYFNGHL